MRVVILGMSDKNNGYCIGGVEYETSTPVRLIDWHRLGKELKFGDEITDDLAIYKDGKLCRVLDVIDVDAVKIDENVIKYLIKTETEEIKKEKGCDSLSKDEEKIIENDRKYLGLMLSIQPENYLVRPMDRFRFVQHLSWEEFLETGDHKQFISKPSKADDVIFMNDDSKLTEKEAVENNSSLALVEFSDLNMFLNQSNDSENGKSPAHYKASFKYKDTETEYTLTVTDPDFSVRNYDLGDQDGSKKDHIERGYMLLSVAGKPYNPQKKEAYYRGDEEEKEGESYHYKMIARIFTENPNLQPDDHYVLTRLLRPMEKEKVEVIYHLYRNCVFINDREIDRYANHRITLTRAKSDSRYRCCTYCEKINEQEEAFHRKREKE